MMASLIGFGVLFLLAFAGVPLAFAMLIVGTVGFALLRGSFESAFSMLAQQVVDASANDGMAVLPMFILMGLFVHKSDLSEELYKAANAWLGHLRGGLAHATVAACALFAAISGSSIATAATMSKVAIPPMRRLGYHDALSCGSVASAGVLGVLIPPSVPLVVYGLLTNTDIRQLFIAAIVPGLMLALLFLVAVVLVVTLRPEWGATGERKSWRERFTSLKSVWMVLVLFIAIIGGLYAGIFTATESAGMGASGALLIGLLRRKITWSNLFECLMDTARTTAMIFTIVFGAFVFANFITLSGLTSALIDTLQQQSMGTLGLLLMMVAIYLVLGALMESLSLLILTAPIFHAIATSMGIHPIWFGIFVVMMIEIGLLTPPVGMNVFTVKTMNPDVPIRTIFAGSMPFVAANIVGVGVFIAFPIICLFLLSWL